MCGMDRPVSMVTGISTAGRRIPTATGPAIRADLSRRIVLENPICLAMRLAAPAHWASEPACPSGKADRFRRSRPTHPPVCQTASSATPATHAATIQGSAGWRKRDALAVQPIVAGDTW